MVKSRCADCTPCPHGKLKYSCAECNPCSHGKLKYKCADCNPCPHGKLKNDCTECNPCSHGKLKYACAACKSTRAVRASSPPDKETPTIKLEAEIKEEPFNMHGYYDTGDEDA
jgi:hypothetical protein